MMQQRFLYLWFPELGCERHIRAEPSPETRDLLRRNPFATTMSDHRGIYLCALNASARACALTSGQRLSDARAIFPDLQTRPADSRAEKKELLRLGDLAETFSPWVALDGPQSDSGSGGLWLDMSGAAHLFGGEQNLMGQVRELYTAHIQTLHLGMADNAWAAWAAARFSSADARLNEGKTIGETDHFPLESLNIDHALVQRLNRLGLRKLADLRALPRPSLTTRFGPIVLERLDRLAGRHNTSLNYLKRPHIHQSTQFFAEPLGSAEIVREHTLKILNQLCNDLKAKGLGIRTLAGRYSRVDGQIFMIRIQTSSAAQDVSLLMRLLDNRLPGVDAGFGIEQIQLFAPHTQWIDAQQQELTTTTSRPNGTGQLNGLIDRLRQRLGHQALSYRHLRASHLPEQSFVHCDQSGTHKTPTTLPPRPIRLLRPAEAIEVDQFDSLARPLQFNWRRQTIKRVNISGPERLSRQWWQKLDQDIWDHALGLRDYYRITDQEGRDLWVCGWHSQKEKVRWFVHGWFG